jgi:hypothetical protein
LYCAAEAAPTDLKPQWSNWFNTMVSAVLILSTLCGGINPALQEYRIFFSCRQGSFFIFGHKSG